jgi:hypothetical protein
MKVSLIIILSILSLTGCEYIDRVKAHIEGYSKMCIDGVTYIQFTSGASVAYGEDGHVKIC